MEYLVHILIMINIYIILVLSANLLIGLSNLLTLCQAAFYGIGAYLTALALMTLGLTLLPALLFAVLITAILGFLLGYVSIRFKGDYFVLATLGFQIIIYSILYNWISVTRGPYGIPGIPSPVFLGIFKVSSIYQFFILSGVLSLLTIGIFYKFIHSPFGRALRAMKDDKPALVSLGRNVRKLKIQTFVIASLFAAVSGFLYATYITYIDPTSFSLDESIFIVTAVLIGGTGNVKGPVLGAIFVVILPEILRFVGMPDNVAANMRMIIYGLTLILLMMFRPQGIAGKNRI